MGTRFMNEYEKEMLAFMQELNDLKVQMHNIEKRAEYVKNAIETMQERFFDLEEKYGRA